MTQLVRADEIFGVSRAVRPDRGRRECLRGFGFVRQDRTHCVNSQARVGHQLILLVGVHQAAQLILRTRQNAIGKQILNPVEHFNSAAFVAYHRDRGMLYETKAIRGRPRIRKLKTQIVIELFKNKLVAQYIFVEVSRELVDTCMRAREGLPKCSSSLLLSDNNGSATGISRIILNLVFRVIRE